MTFRPGTSGWTRGCRESFGIFASCAAGIRFYHEDTKATKEHEEEGGSLFFVALRVLRAFVLKKEDQYR
jgi:hypothetical protein